MPNDPSILFDASQSPEELLQEADVALLKATELSAWFELNKIDLWACNLTYISIPSHYVYKDSMWVRRKRKSNVLGRLYPANTRCPESCALRMLLQEVKGCKSIEELRLGHDSFHDAALALGLIDDSLEWMKLLNTARRHITPEQFRMLFNIVLDFCFPSDSEELLTKFFGSLTDDFQNQHLELVRWAVINGKSSFLKLIHKTYPIVRETDALIMTDLEQTVSNPSIDISVTQLTDDQKHIHDSFVGDVKHFDLHKASVLLAPAGCGKTFLINSILTTAKRMNRRIVPCASSALAASLLGNCRTAHTTFAIPISVDDTTIIRVPLRKKMFLKSVDAFIWDEMSMAHKWAIDAVDRLLRDIHHCDVPFGGVPILFVGDFRQLLPVHRFAVDPAAYCCRVCEWYNSAQLFRLNSNIRAVDHSWAAFVLDIGNGRNPVQFPSECCVNSVDALIQKVWQKDFSLTNCEGRAILTSTRHDATLINSMILDMIPGVTDVALSHSQVQAQQHNLYKNTITSPHFNFTQNLGC